MSPGNVERAKKEASSFWGPLSLAMPLGAGLLSCLFLVGGRPDMAGLKYLLYSLAGVGGAGVAGMAAVIIAEIRTERKPAYRTIGFFLNGAIIIIGLYFSVTLMRR